MSKGNYRHKDIPALDTQNAMLLKNQETLPVLKKIYDGDIPYTSDFYPMLVNNMERLYKGITQELQALYPDAVRLSSIQYREGHHFNQFASIINQYIPLSDDRNGYLAVLDGIHNIQKSYNGTRFEDSPDIEEFRRTYRRYETQTFRLYRGLAAQQEKCRAEREDDEISLW
jgi:hypothetical protein